MAAPMWCVLQEDEETVEARSAKRRPSRRRAGPRRFPPSRTAPFRVADGDPCLSVDVACSEHATLRLAQRHLTRRQLAYVLAYGTEVSRTGAVFHILRRCDMDPADWGRDEIAKLEGVAVVIQGGHVITVYRNRHSYGAVQKKPKHAGRRRSGGELPATASPLAA